MTIVLQGLTSLVVVDIMMILFATLPNIFFQMVVIADAFIYRAIIINVILVICILFFSSIELLVSFFARNFKEGQILSMPLMICIIAPFYFEMIYQHNLTRSILYYCVPFLNIPHLFSDIIQNRFSFLSLLSFACINVVVNVIITKIIIVIMSKESSLNRR